MEGVRLARWLAARFAGRPDVRGVALVGSYARDAATPDSDLDLLVLTEDPDAYRAGDTWHAEVPWEEVGTAVSSFRDADYGRVWSRHLTLTNGPVVEMGFAPLDWARTDPVDPGSARIVRDGCLILHDPDGALARLVAVL